MADFSIPRLVTARLVLRAPVAADFPVYAALMASPRARFMGGPFDTRTAWGIFCHDIAQWSLFGHGALMMDLATSGVCVGQVGINHGPLFPERELGWLVYDGQEGHGYATEAARALRGWAAAGGIRGLVSYIDPGMTAPWRSPNDWVRRLTTSRHGRIHTIWCTAIRRKSVARPRTSGLDGKYGRWCRRSGLN